MTLSHPHLIRRQITLAEYHKMIEAGILTEQDKVELIEGDIIRMSPKGSRHAACVQKINRWFSGRLGNQYDIRLQDPVQIPNISEPEPDLVLVTFREDFYTHSHPKPADILLLVEVADSSLSIDREIKLPLYAAAGIPEYWIINLRDRQIEVHRQLKENRYRESLILKPNEWLVIPSLDIKTEVADWLV